LKRDYHNPNPYVPGGLNAYESDKELEVDAENPGEPKRHGNWGLKLTQLEWDQYRCRSCSKEVQAKTSNLDHIKPVHYFPSFEAASTEDNLQILCLECHKEKHASKKAKK
jgi:hypothetical protein